MVNDMTPQIIELGKASRRSAIWGGFGLSVVAISLAVATWMLYRAANLLTLKGHALDVANTELDSARAKLADVENQQRAAQLDIENLAADVATKTDELESALKRLQDIDELAAKSGRAAWVGQVQRVVPSSPPARSPDVPLVEVARVEWSAAPTGERLGNHVLRDIRLWLALPDSWTDNILKVEYVFDEPGISQTKTSFDATKSFQIRYKGWRCANKVRVTVFERSGTQTEIPFEMCSAPAWESMGEPASPLEAR